MAQVLTEYVLELVVDYDVPLGQDAQADRREVDSAAKLVARGGVDGAIQAVNLSMPDGYELRQRRPE